MLKWFLDKKDFIDELKFLKEELLSDDPLVRLYAKEKLNQLKKWGIK